MSINDILNDDSFLLYVGIAFIIMFIICIPIGIASFKSTKKAYGDNESGPIEEKNNVKIVSKEVTSSPFSRAVKIYSIIFELEDGERISLAIKDANIYSTLVQGDKGKLLHRGKQFITFTREDT